MAHETNSDSARKKELDFRNGTPVEAKNQEDDDEDAATPE